jgi:CRP/FNR family cyclic AMP-dependent transcriptional regulator
MQPGVDVPRLIAALPESLGRLAARGAVRVFERGELLIREGDEGDALYIILEGRARAFSSNNLGDRSLTFGTFGPGEFLGEMGLDGGRRSVSIDAEDRVVCSIVTRRSLEEHIREFPAFAFELLSKAIQRARNSTQAAQRMVFEDVYCRLRSLLGSMAESHSGDDIVIRTRLTQRQMAERIGCSREMVSRLMRDLVGGRFVSDCSPPMRILRPLPERW